MVEVTGMEEVRADRAKSGFVLLVALLVLAAGAKVVLYDTLDPDLFWHLRVADQISQQPFPGPLVDTLAFASSKAPWTPYSWLAELGMKHIWDIGGYRAAVGVAAVMNGAIVAFIAMIALELSRARYGQPRYLPAALAGFAGAFLSLPYLSFRPVTFALLVLAVIAWLLQRDIRLVGRSKAVWMVIPLTALLVNVHLYAMFVPAAVLALLVGTCTWRYALMLGGVSVACLMTPMLPGVIEAAWQYQFSDVMVRARSIAEFRPFYQSTLGGVSGVVVLIILASAVWNRRLLDRGQWIWLIGSLIVLLRMGRFAPIFAIFGVPMFAIVAPALSDSVLERRALRFALAIILICGGLRVAMAFPTRQVPLSVWMNRMGPDCGGYPTEAADYVQNHVLPETHHLIDELTWGGYLEWRLGDTYQVLMDGRTQLFSADFWNSVYLGTSQQRAAYLAGLHADAAILIAHGSKFAPDLLRMGWTVGYVDARAQVLLPPREPLHMVAAYRAM